MIIKLGFWIKVSFQKACNVEMIYEYVGFEQRSFCIIASTYTIQIPVTDGESFRRGFFSFNVIQRLLNIQKRNFRINTVNDRVSVQSWRKNFVKAPRSELVPQLQLSDNLNNKKKDFVINFRKNSGRNFVVFVKGLLAFHFLLF